MTLAELKQDVENLGAPEIPALISDLIPCTTPHILISNMLFVLLDDELVSFPIVSDGKSVMIILSDMMEGEKAMTYWTLANHNVKEFERDLSLGLPNKADLPSDPS